LVIIYVISDKFSDVPVQSEPIKVSMPLVEVYTQTFLKEGSGLVTASFPQSGFLHEHGNIGKQTLLTTFAFL